MKFENANELNTYINANYKKINITGIDMENLEIFIDGEITKNKQYAFIKFSDEKAYMQYKNQHDIAGIDALKVVSHQINVEEFYTLMNSKKVAYIEFIKIEEEIQAGELTYTDTTVGWAFDRANIGYAWERGYTGAGIKALIVDKGFHEVPGELEFVEVYGEDDLTGSHGTQVASCLGAKMNNTGLVGVAPDIELYGFAKRGAGGTINSILPEFINYIIDNGIRIVNFSIVIPAADTSQTINEAFEYLDSLGVLVFASMGNFGQNFPRSLYARVPTTIGVGGILLDSNGNFEISTGATGATNNADCDYLFSYGTNVLLPDGTVTQATGTSFGTPAIAGMFALLMQEFPNATRKQLMDIMNYNGEKVDDYYGIFPKYGSHTEMLVEICPPDWDSNLKVYPVTLSSGVIEKGNKLFVNQEEREYLEKVKGKDFIENLDAQLITDALGYIPLPISGGVLENYREKITTLASGTINLNTGNVFTHTPSADTTYSISNAVNGHAHSFTLIINMGSTVRTLTFPSSVKWQGGEIPDLSNANKTYVLTFMTVDGGTTWLGMFGGEF